MPASIQTLVNAHAITVAQSIATQGKEHRLPDGCNFLLAEADFVYSGGGTTAKVFIQTTLDPTRTDWTDVMSFSFTTASGRKFLSVSDAAVAAAITGGTLGTLTADTSRNVIGMYVRAQVVTTGTYTGTNTMTVRLRIGSDT